MAGHYSENEISQAVRRGTLTGKGGAWDLIAQRVAAVPDYAARFMAVYPDVTAPQDIAFTDISNAVAAFMEFEWRSDTAPFDALLAGAHSYSGARAWAVLWRGGMLGLSQRATFDRFWVSCHGSTAAWARQSGTF
jgi:cytochrome c peroxidase